MHPNLQEIIDEIWQKRPLGEEEKKFIARISEELSLVEQSHILSSIKPIARELKQMQEMQHAIIDSAKYAIIATDEYGLIKVFNKGAEKMLGYSASEIIDKETPLLFHDKEDVKKKMKKLNGTNFYEVFWKATQQEEAYEDEWIYQHKDGHTFPVSLSFTSRKNDKGELIGFLGIASDISQRKLSEQKLSESEERYRKLIESARDIFYTTDDAGNFTYVNEVVEEKIGYRQEEILGKHYTFLIKEDYQESVQKFYSDEVAAKQPFSYLEFPIVCKNGDIMWVGQNVQILFTDGVYTGTQAIVRDITNTKGAEIALAASEERFRKLVQFSSDVTTLLSSEGIILYESSSFYRIFEYQHPITGRSVFEFVHPDDLLYVKKEFQKGIERGGLSDRIEFRLLSANGEWKYVEAIGNNLLHEPSIQGIVINTREISERKKTEKALAETNASLAAVLESTNDIIFAIDKNYKYIGYNDAHKKSVKTLFGIDIGTDSYVTAQKEVHEKAGDAFRFLERGLNGEQFTTVNEYSGKYFETTYNPIRDEKGEVTGVAVFSKNITESKNTQETLLRAKNEAEAAAQIKSDFLSNMSHEIRTPMNAIIGITDLLIQKEFEAETQQYLNSIKYSADNLLVIINDILDFSKIESGKISFEQIDFHLKEKVEEVYKTFKPKMEEKGIVFSKSIDETIPAIIKGDPYRLNQILFNLVGNAIKFTLKGFVKIDVRCVHEADDYLVLRFGIEDSGIGIPKEKQETIFESFTQAFTDTTRRFGGTGLGLAITKNLVVLQGGTISLHSIADEGTTFVIEIPFKKSTTLFTNTKNMQDTNNRDLSGARVLIVEDNMMNQFVVKQIMSKWNANMVIANNGTEAILLLKEQDFDIVLMDLQMPEMSGYQAAEYIRSKNSSVKNPSIPVIALSADAFAETKRKVFEAGMNDFITKPFSQEELYSKMTKHLQ